MTDETKKDTQLWLVDFALLARAEVLKGFCTQLLQVDQFYFHRAALRIDIGVPDNWQDVLDIADNMARRFAFDQRIDPLSFDVNMKLACARIEEEAKSPEGMLAVAERLEQYQHAVEAVIVEENLNRMKNGSTTVH